MIVPPITSNRGLRFIAFCIFECCIGIFWPAISTLRSVYIPEDIRSTMMNVFRVPLNFLVVMILIPNLALPTVFLVCSFLLFLSVLLASLLYQETQTTPIQQTRYLVHDIWRWYRKMRKTWENMKKHEQKWKRSKKTLHFKKFCEIRCIWRWLFMFRCTSTLFHRLW